MKSNEDVNWGVRVIRGTTVNYINCGVKADALAAKEAWDKDEPSSSPRLVHRDWPSGEWEFSN
jgi:hypothetical protein